MCRCGFSASNDEIYVLNWFSLNSQPTQVLNWFILNFQRMPSLFIAIVLHTAHTALEIVNYKIGFYTLLLMHYFKIVSNLFLFFRLKI